jgi:mRNA-degrading endonuclease YafQ of YafQ-DinJ toxin-antitoxin module
MDFDLRFTDVFLKRFNSITKNDQQLKRRVKKTLELLQLDPYYPSLHTHKVINDQWGEVLSSRVTGDIRIIWTFDKENRLILILLEIGGHDEVY